MDPDDVYRVGKERNVSMDIREAIKARHSVRQYKDLPIAEDLKAELEQEIAECNRESGLHIQIIYDDPECFDTFLSHYGKFSNVKNYISRFPDPPWRRLLLWL